MQGSNDLRNLVSSLAPGSTATVTLVRDGQQADRDREARRDGEPSARAATRRRPANRAALGIKVEPLTPRLAERLEAAARPRKGSMVDEVDPDGAAAAAGIEAGDVIRQVDGKAVASAGDLRAARTRRRADRPALVLVQRGDRSFFAAIDRSRG